jgi:uncharacterized membrane protein HdeD (DUF308 family)
MVDLTAMLINLSNSLLPVQRFLSGMGYLFGILMIISGVIKLKSFGERQHQQATAAVPLALIGGGALLLYLPSSISVFSNTFFGANNILSYAPINPNSFYNALLLLIQTAGVVWFVRGIALCVHASEPGQQEGLKGFTFLIAGILAINFEGTISAVNYAFSSFFSMMSTVKSNI